MAKNKQKLQRARVLGGFTLDGINYQPNDVIESYPKLISSLGSSVDPSDDAVNYCLNEAGSVVKVHAFVEPTDEDDAGDLPPDTNPDNPPAPDDAGSGTVAE